MKTLTLSGSTHPSGPSRATVTNWLEEDNRGGHAPLRDNVAKIGASGVTASTQTFADSQSNSPRALYVLYVASCHGDETLSRDLNKRSNCTSESTSL